MEVVMNFKTANFERLPWKCGKFVQTFQGIVVVGDIDGTPSKPPNQENPFSDIRPAQCCQTRVLSVHVGAYCIGLSGQAKQSNVQAPHLQQAMKPPLTSRKATWAIWYRIMQPRHHQYAECVWTNWYRPPILLIYAATMTMISLLPKPKMPSPVSRSARGRCHRKWNSHSPARNRNRGARQSGLYGNGIQPCPCRISAPTESTYNERENARMKSTWMNMSVISLDNEPIRASKTNTPSSIR